MKKTILPALAMLIVAAVMLSTASYAWFAMRSEVSATDMTVSVKSESEYMLIMAVGADYVTTDAATVLSDIRTQNVYTVQGQAIGDKIVAPAAHVTTDAAGFASPASWYTAVGAASNAATANDSTKTVLSNLNGYVVRYRYIVAMAEGSNPKDGAWLKNVEVLPQTTISGNQTIDPVKVVVTCGTNYYEFGHTDDGVAFAQRAGGAANLFTGELNDNTFYEVMVYVYYDGNHAKLYTDNFANIVPAKVSISLTTTDPAAN